MEEDKRNWKGIFIAILVILVMCSIIGATVYYFNPQIIEFGRQTKKDRLTLEEIVYGVFAPRTFNGTWLSNEELMYRDSFGNLVIMNVSSHEEEAKLIVANYTFQQYYAQKYSLSPDRKYLLMVYNIKKQFRHTYLAIHVIQRISDEVRWHVGSSPDIQDLQYAEWGPTGSQLVFVENDNVYLQKCADCTPQAVTHTIDAKVIFNGVPDWLYEEEILSKNNAVWFSPNGTKLCYATFDDSNVEVVKFPFYGSLDDVNSAGTYHIRYPKPGRTNPTVTLSVTDTSNPERSVKVVPPAEIEETEYYFTTITWIDESRLMVTWIRREQNYSSISVCRENRTLTTLDWTCSSIETVKVSKGWVDIYEAPIISQDLKHYFLLLPLLESSEVGSFKHIFQGSLDGSDALRSLTHGEFDTTEILKFDAERKFLYYISTLKGKAGERHLFRVHTSPSRKKILPECMSCHIGPHCLYVTAHFNQDASFYVLECLGPGIPTAEIRNLYDVYNETHGRDSLVQIIQGNDQIREALEAKALPRIKTLSVAVEGGYNASVKLFLPPDLNEQEVTKYPLLIQVYGGPGSQQVNERFNIHWGYYLSTKKNIIYGMIDGRGSGFKGDKFLHEVYLRLGSVEVEDQLKVTRYLRDNLTYINRDKIGMWGWSYGGYVTAMALTTDEPKQPLLSCGVSVAPVTDWLLYDSAYTERFMSSPNSNRKNYAKSSVLNRAINMKGKKFLLVHGTADDNVHISQSMLFIKALSTKGVLFRSQVYPDENHGLHGVSRHLYQTMEDFWSECFALDVVHYDEVGLKRRPSRQKIKME